MSDARFELWFDYSNARPDDLSPRWSMSGDEGQRQCAYVCADSAEEAREQLHAKAERYGREIEIRWTTRCNA